MSRKKQASFLSGGITAVHFIGAATSPQKPGPLQACCWFTTSNTWWTTFYAPESDEV